MSLNVVSNPMLDASDEGDDDMDHETARELGALGARVAFIEERQKQIETVLQAINGKLDLVIEKQNQQAGGLRVLHWFSLPLMAVGGWLASHFFHVTVGQ